jgi:hypothetical protein
MPPFGWVAIEAPCCAPVHVYFQVDGEEIKPAEYPLWLPNIGTPDDPEEDGGGTVRYLFHGYGYGLHRARQLSEIGEVMVEARRLYNEHIRLEIEWAEKARAAKEEPKEETQVPSGPTTPEEKLWAALEELVNQVIDAGLEWRGL